MMTRTVSYEEIIFMQAKHPNRWLSRHAQDFLEVLNGMRLYISGEDLQKFGLPPGPRYQKIFAVTLKAKLEGRVKTKAEELDLIRKLVISR